MGILRCRREGQLALQGENRGQAAEMGFQRRQGTQGRDGAPRAVGSPHAGRRLPCAKECRGAAGLGLRVPL